MKKTLRKITIILIICLLVLPLVPLKHAEAAVVTETTDNGVLSFEGENTVILGQSEYVCYYTVKNAEALALNEGMAGFWFRIAWVETESIPNAIDSNKDIVVECQTEGWSITEANKDCDEKQFYYAYDVLVEADNEKIINRNAPQEVKIKCSIPLVSIEERNNENKMNYSSGPMSITDYDGNVITTSDSDALYNAELSTQIDLTMINEISVKEGYEEKVTIDADKNIFAKLDGNSETDTNTHWSDFFNTIYGLEGVISYSIKDFSGTVDRWISENYDSNTASTAKLLVKYAGDTEITYNLYLLGDIKLDTNYQIDINDVSYLRQAIVGSIDPETTEDFCLETTDVNNSNVTEEGRALGDIGDVILLRKRIINCKWD